MSYLYWAVDCKTPGCETRTPVKYVGVYDATNWPFLIGMKPSPLSIKCRKCAQSYDYEEPELIPVINEQEPPSDFPNMF